MDDGTRTHDDRHHKPGLYQLSYAHHCYIAAKAAPTVQIYWRARQDLNLQPSA